MKMTKIFARLTQVALFVFVLSHAPLSHALTIDPFYSGSYSVSSLGSVPGLPANYGGLTFISSNTILIGGQANTTAGRLYTIDVIRDAGTNRITDFSGTAAQFGGPGSGIGDFNDGGVVFGPGDVLFMARWNVNEIGQVAPGTTADENRIDSGPVGASSSMSALNFVPASFGGAGDMKVVTYSSGQWYDAAISPDGQGTFNIGPYTQVDVDPTVAGVQNVPGGPEGFVYISAGNPLFSVNSMLISEYSVGQVGAYIVDGLGNPLVNTRQTFLGGLLGTEGAAIDPVTGDFLFSTFGGGNQIALVSGFLAPPPPPPPPPGVPEPSSLLLLGAAVATIGLAGCKKVFVASK